MEEQNQYHHEKKDNKTAKDSPLLLGMNLVNICVFLMMIIGVGTMAWLLPKETESQVEKRELAKAPEFSAGSLFSGEFAEQMDLFFADTFPGREGLVFFASKMEEIRGIRPGDVRIYNADRYSSNVPMENQNKTTPLVPGGSEQNSKPDTSNAGAAAPSNGLSPDDENARGEQMGTVFLYKNMAMSIFGGNSAVSKRYAQTINQYHAQLGDGVQIYSAVIPTSAAFYLPEKNKSISADQKENIEKIYSALDPKVKSVDAYTQIEKAKDKYIYFRSDHHWTVRGAYAAYEAFCTTAGLPPVPLSDMDMHQIDNFLGTFYNQTQDSKLKETPDFVEYFVPPGEMSVSRYLRNKPFTPQEGSLFASYATGGSNTYGVFLHGDYPLTHVKTGKTTGKKILVVKESFGNAFAPFLVSHFDEVFIVDQRYFQLGLVNFIKEKGITDLLFINNIFAANTDIRVDEIARIMSQNYVAYTPKPVPPPEEPKETPPPEPVKEDPKQDIPEAEDEEPEEEEKLQEKKKVVIKKHKAEEEPQPEEETLDEEPGE